MGGPNHGLGLETWHLPAVGVGGGAWAVFGVGFPGFTLTFPPCPTGGGWWRVVAVGGRPGAVGLSWAACPSLPCGHGHCCL